MIWQNCLDLAGLTPVCGRCASDLAELPVWRNMPVIWQNLSVDSVPVIWQNCLYVDVGEWCASDLAECLHVILQD